METEINNKDLILKINRSILNMTNKYPQKINLDVINKSQGNDL